MPIDPRKRQKALARQAAKRKARNVALRQEQHREREFQASARPLLRAAGQWPLHEVLITTGWEDTGEICQILVARRSPTGEMAAGVFLVDLACLGVKSAFARLF